MIDPDILDTPLGRAVRRAALDSVDGAFGYSAGEDLAKPGLRHRRRTRIVLTDETGQAHELYLKRYDSEPLRARLRRCWTYGPLTSPAGVEARNIRIVRQLGIATMQALAWGRQSGLLGVKRSYLLVTAVPGQAIARMEPGPVGGQTEFARQLTQQLADLARTLHEAGYAHRDFYASHIFVDDGGGQPRLHLIDLARLFAPRLCRRRWIVKDLAQLRYSMPEDWRNYWWRDFLGWYGPGRAARDYRSLHHAVEARVAAIRRHDDRKFAQEWQRKNRGPA